MTDPPAETDGTDSSEVEVNLDDGARLELQHVEVEADEPPVSFTVSGLLHDVEDDVLAKFENRSLKPTAIQFEVLDL